MGLLHIIWIQRRKRSLRLKSTQYQLIQGVLCRKNYDGVYLRCLEKRMLIRSYLNFMMGLLEDILEVILQLIKYSEHGYYWPTLFKDSHAYAWKCQECQKAAGRERKPAFPLQPVTIECPFQQWGLDVIGEINPNSSKLHKYIITTTNYFTSGLKQSH
jgi:hypothetical protein